MSNTDNQNELMDEVAKNVVKETTNDVIDIQIQNPKKKRNN